MADKTYSQDDVRKLWSTKAGRVEQYDLVEIEAVDGTQQTQLVDKDTGSISVAVNGVGDATLRKLAEHAGDTFIDGAEPPKEAVDVKSQRRYTSRGVLATPTQPENLQGEQEPTEVDHRKPEDAKQNEPQEPVVRTESTESVQLTENGNTEKLDVHVDTSDTRDTTDKPVRARKATAKKANTKTTDSESTNQPDTSVKLTEEQRQAEAKAKADEQAKADADRLEAEKNARA